MKYVQTTLFAAITFSVGLYAAGYAPMLVGATFSWFLALIGFGYLAYGNPTFSEFNRLSTQPRSVAQKIHKVLGISSIILLPPILYRYFS